MKNKPPVSYIEFESVLARMERTVKRLWVLCIILFFIFAITNCIWIIREIM